MSREICETIVKQLGGEGKLKAMIGMKDLVFGLDTNSIMFKFKRSENINCIRVALNGNDLYDVTFYNIAKFDFKEVCGFKDVYVEDLKKLIELKINKFLSF